MDERDNCNNFEFELQDNRDGNGEKMSETEPLTIRDSANDKTKESCLEYSESVNDCANNGKVILSSWLSSMSPLTIKARNNIFQLHDAYFLVGQKVPKFSFKCC